MQDQSKTKQKLIEELASLRQRIAELEMAESINVQPEEPWQGREAFFQLITDNVPALIAYVDAEDLRYRFVNKHYEVFFEKPRETIIGKKFREIIGEENYKFALPYLESALTGKSTSYENLFMTSRGRSWFRINYVPDMDKSGIVKGVFILNVDITERKLAEEALRENETRLIKAQEIAHLGSWELDLSTNHLIWSDEIYRIFGLRPQEFGATYEAFLDAIHPDDRAAVDAAYSSSLREGQDSYEIEHRVVRKHTRDIRYVHERCEHVRDTSGRIVRSVGMVHDITERKRAEEALKAAEETYRNIFLNAQTGLFRTDMNTGLILDANDCVARFIGYKDRGNLLSKPFNIAERYVDPKDRERMIFLLKEHGQFTNFETRFRRNDGSIIWIRFSAKIVPDKGWIEGVSEDITKEKDAEEVLRESEKRFRELAELLPETVYETDIQGTLTFVNRNAFDRFGYTQEDFAGGLNALDMVTPDDRDRALENIQRIMNGQNIDSNEFTMRRKDGSTFYSMIHSTAIIHDDKSVGLRGFIVDINERKRAEEALRDTQQMLRNILDNFPGVVFWKDRNSVYQGCNRAFAKAAGINETHEITGKTDHDMPWAQSEAEEYRNMDRAVMESGVPRLLIIESQHEADGRVGWYETSKVPLFDETGKVIGVLGVSGDITERKRAEEEKRSLEERLQRAEKMEALGTLAGGVAHDLNNVLGVVVGYAELLLNSVDESSSIRPRLVNIMKGGERAAAIVQDLLTLARRGVPSRTVLNLNSIIADFQHSPEFEKLSSYHSSVQIKTDLDPELLNISGSSVHLGKTLFNLVSNASESMTKGGIVTIRTANQYLDKPIQGYDEVREGDYVVLSVSDTGEGIPASELKRIFEPFYTKKVMGRSGTGLGLAVVWGTVKDHHGYINLESEEGKGSTFTLYFPVTREDISAERIAVSTSEYMGNGESILVVDDVKGQRDLAAEMLQTLNYNVTTVSSGEEAVAYLKEHHADVMVLDMIMDPGMDGLDTYRSVLAIRPKQKAIIVSGFSETDRVKAAQSLGVGAYVRKPYVIEKLGLAVRKELDRK